MDKLYMKYFVLKPKGDDVYAYASRASMLTYARMIQQSNPSLAKELREWVEEFGD